MREIVDLEGCYLGEFVGVVALEDMVYVVYVEPSGEFKQKYMSDVRMEKS